MPIFAAPAVSETSMNTGAAAGNELPTVTVLLVPFTEIVALVAVPGTGVDPCAIRSDGFLFGFGFAVETGFEEAAVEPLAAAAEPSRVGGASGVEPAVVEVAAGGVDEVLSSPFIIFIVL